MTLGTTAPTISDSAVLAGGYNETGTVSFTLKLGSTPVYTTSDPVSGNGTYTASYTLPTTGTVTGTYTWTPATAATQQQRRPTAGRHQRADGGQRGQPTISTTPSATSVTLGNAGRRPSRTRPPWRAAITRPATITFTLYYGSSVVDTETAAVSGNGSYTTPTGYTLPTTGTVTGTYQWDASYGADGNNNAVSDNNNANEQVAVGLASPTITTTASPA